MQADREKQDGEGAAKFLLSELLGLIKRELNKDIFDDIFDVFGIANAVDAIRKSEAAARQVLTIGFFLQKLTIAAKLGHPLNLMPRNSLMTILLP
ncbi:hypothetical protein SCO12_12105 [Legionella pneumophila serogroup 10]